MKRETWGRLLAEGTVIIVSILLALAADEWAQQRRDRSMELDILLRLEAELTAAEADLLQWQDYQRGVVDAGGVLLAASGPVTAVPLPPDSIGALVWDLTFSYAVDPALGVLASLISTNGLAQIENAALRTALIEWNELLRNLQRNEVAAHDANERRLSPFLEGQVATRSLIAASDMDPGMGASSFPSGVEELLRSREFESLVANRVMWISQIIRMYDGVLAELQSVRLLVSDELSEA